MTGRRVDADPDEPNQYPYPKLQSGEYGKGLDGVWYARPPWKHASGNLKGHTVTEHDDGTITVSPSILIQTVVGDWHGFLERGVWREC